MESATIIIGALIVAVLVMLLIALRVQGEREKLSAKFDGLINFFGEAAQSVIITRDGIDRLYEVRPVVYGEAVQVLEYRGDKGPKGRYEIRRLR